MLQTGQLRYTDGTSHTWEVGEPRFTLRQSLMACVLSHEGKLLRGPCPQKVRGDGSPVPEEMLVFSMLRDASFAETGVKEKLWLQIERSCLLDRR